MTDNTHENAYTVNFADSRTARDAMEALQGVAGIRSTFMNRAQPRFVVRAGPDMTRDGLQSMIEQSGYQPASIDYGAPSVDELMG